MIAGNQIYKTIIVYMLICTFGCIAANAQKSDTISTRWQKYIDLKKYSKPFWQADTIIDETVQVIKENDLLSGKLLFKAKTILSVKATNYSKQFLKGKDWNFKDGQLVIDAQSAVPFIKKEDLLFKTYKQGFSMDGKVQGTYVLFTEKPFFSGLQIAVTYIKAKGEKWQGPVPSLAKNELPNTITKLKNRQKLKIVFYGNSIEAGYNTSNLMNTPPYMPTWPELIIYNLRRLYGPQITFSNQAIAGKLASWGLEQVSTKVIPERPDLVVIGFGMNDGSANIPVEKFKSDIDGIIKAITAQNPDAEFILIAPMLPNPDAIQSGIQSSYKAELDKLAGKGIVVADMTGVHAELLKHKIYQDMTGNNVNHPNDYLARWYAQTILGFLEE